MSWLNWFRILWMFYKCLLIGFHDSYVLANKIVLIFFVGAQIVASWWNSYTCWRTPSVFYFVWRCSFSGGSLWRHPCRWSFFISTATNSGWGGSLTIGMVEGKCYSVSNSCIFGTAISWYPWFSNWDGEDLQCCRSSHKFAPLPPWSFECEWSYHDL